MSAASRDATTEPKVVDRAVACSAVFGIDPSNTVALPSEGTASAFTLRLDPTPRSGTWIAKPGGEGAAPRFGWTNTGCVDSVGWGRPLVVAHDGQYVSP